MYLRFRFLQEYLLFHRDGKAAKFSIKTTYLFKSW